MDRETIIRIEKKYRTILGYKQDEFGLTLVGWSDEIGYVTKTFVMGQDGLYHPLDFLWFGCRRPGDFTPLDTEA